MRNIIYVIFLIGIAGCSPNDVTDKEPQQKNPIEKFGVQISSPIQTRDYSFHHPEEAFKGYDGIFTNPVKELAFTGNIEISFSTSGEEVEIPVVEVVWRSDLDGVLQRGNLGEDLETDLQKKLSKGIHTVYLEASIPGTEFVAKDSVVLSNTIELNTKSTGKSVELNWSKYEGQDFVSYLIYRQDHTPVAEITDIEILEYTVPGGNSFIAEHEYQVVVRTTNTYDHPVGSNISLQAQGIFIKFPHFVHKIIKDPLRSKIYAIVGPQYSHYDSNTFGLLIINVAGETFEIESHILQDRKFADLDISPDGQHLFLVQEYVDQITKLNLDLLEAETYPTNTNGWGFHKIEVGVENTLYCHRNPPTSGSTSFWIYNGNNGNLVQSQTSVLRHGDIEFNQINNTLYGGESNTSNGSMFRFRVDAFSMERDKQYPEWPDYAAYPWPHIFISEDGQFVFWENFQLDQNLNVIRTFETGMKAVSPNNKYLSNFEFLYNFDNLDSAYKYPVLPLADLSSILFLDDETVVLARAENTGMNQEEYTYFFKINL